MPLRMPLHLHDNRLPDRRAIQFSVLVAALGYFVDIYDLILFSIVRVKSLVSIGVPASQLLDTGALLLNMQMGGMLLGGLLWGILGDRRGRLSVLFGSIALYSAANIANAFVGSVGAYAALRLIAGIGLAGELGAGITLVSEIMSRESRGYGTTIVAAVGITGAVAAALVGDFFDWRIAYIVGGVMGIALLLLRIGVFESGMFQQVKASDVSRGNFFTLFAERRRAIKYVSVILIGVPIWYVVGILVTFSPEFGAAMGMTPPPNAGRAVMFTYIGLAVGDLASGWLSQILQSRKRVVLLFLTLTTLCVATYFFGPRTLTTFYVLCAAMGFATGYWAVFVTIASEQFGTNIRATATTTVPNFVRGAVVLLTLSFQALRAPLGTRGSGMIIGAVTLALAFLALRGLEETCGKDLDYIER
jgi:putative MFS transporter